MCSPFFHITIVWDTDMRFTELNLRVFPNALLYQVQAEYHPRITSTEHLDSLSILQQPTDTAHPLALGWLKDCNLIECFLVLYLGTILLSIRCKKKSTLLLTARTMPDISFRPYGTLRHSKRFRTVRIPHSAELGDPVSVSPRDSALVEEPHQKY